MLYIILTIPIAYGWYKLNQYLTDLDIEVQAAVSKAQSEVDLLDRENAILVEEYNALVEKYNALVADKTETFNLKIVGE